MSKKDRVKHSRLPNLSTIIMVEDFLKETDKEVSLPEIKIGLKKQVMHQTLKIVLEYLWKGKKIEYTPKGIKWTFEERK